MFANGVPAITRDLGATLGVGVKAGCVTTGVATGVATGVPVGATEGEGLVGAGVAVAPAVAVAGAIEAGGDETAGLGDGSTAAQPTIAKSVNPTNSRRANVRADPLTNPPLGCSLRSDAAAEPIVTWLLEFNAPHADVRPDDCPAHR